MSTTPRRVPLRRAAIPASEFDWTKVRKDLVGSGALSESGKAPSAHAEGAIAADEAKKLPPIEDAIVEEITLPRKVSCACVDITKCACQVVQKPLVGPNGGESKDDFLSRCMGDSKMVSEFSDEKQRYAVCNSQWTAKQKAKIDLNQARELLDSAIARHERHTDGTEATDEKSQQKLMEELRAARAALGDTRMMATSKSDKEPEGVMVALCVPKEIAKAITIPGGQAEDDLHLTLGYFGKLGKDISPEAADAITKCVGKAITKSTPIRGAISGVGRFAGMDTSDGMDVLYASVDAPGLAKFRTELMDEIQKCSSVIKSEVHDFTPHITLAYMPEDAPMPIHKMGRQEMTFNKLIVAIGKRRIEYNLGETEEMRKMFIPIAKADTERRLVTGVVLQPEVVDAQGDITSAEAIEEAAHAFLASYNKQTQMGLQHQMMNPMGVHLVESWISPVDFNLNGRDIKAGTWLMTVKVDNDDLWAKVKSGKIRGFSIGGMAKVRRLAA